MDYTNFVKKNFINRVEELNALIQRINSNKAEFIIVYGKRRVGKTELLLQLLKVNKNILYYIFRNENEVMQLKRLSEILAEKINDEYLLSNPFFNWDSFFKYIKNKDFILIFDEFPNAVISNQSLPSIFQEYWDLHLKNTKTKIILCGSSIKMMESLLGYKSPIYGRRTAQFLIEPLKFKHAQLFFGNISKEEKIIYYSILGGTPTYLLEFDFSKKVDENILSILKKDSFLFNEVNFILREELNEPRTYFSILSEISKGKTKISELINSTGLDKTTIIRYLSILIDLHLVERKLPFNESINSRKGIYVLKDNFFRFWFRFIFQKLELLQQNNQEAVLKYIKENLNQFVSFSFEEICKDYLRAHYEIVNSWWHKDKEIDIIAIKEQNEKQEILFGECKWQNSLVDTDVYYELKEKSKFVNYKREDREKEKNKNKEKSNKITEKFALFSKSGFTKKMKELAKKENVLLYELNDIL
ncbi:MAG: ATP-binding protein [Candidatus Woesearchaeota archaeon]